MKRACAPGEHAVAKPEPAWSANRRCGAPYHLWELSLDDGARGGILAGTRPAMHNLMVQRAHREKCISLAPDLHPRRVLSSLER
jgi:hypothetical protein